jgi:SOS response regulatory protein OraA/RecX
MALEDPYHESDDDGEEEDYGEQEEEGQTQRRKKQLQQKKEKVTHVDIDMALSAYANSRALYEAKKKATDKASKTVLGKPLG